MLCFLLYSESGESAPESTLGSLVVTEKREEQRRRRNCKK